MKTLFAVLILSVLSFGQCTTNVAPKITSANVIAFTEGSAGSFTVSATGTPTPAISEVGSLPAGVTFSAGKISGSPALGTSGTFALTFVAQNGTAPDASQSFTLTVQPQPVGGLWVPQPITSWAWLLSVTPNASNLPAQAVIDSDCVDTPSSTVAAIHAAGKHWIGYIDVGTWEPGRPDASQFPASVKGNSVQGFRSEHWLDARQIGILTPIMSARMSACKAKGADAFEIDNLDSYENKPGFPTTKADQQAYNKAMAALAHSFGVSVPLKNDGDDVQALLPYFDFAIVEQCLEFSECSIYSPFVAAGKSVLNAEYSGKASTGCPKFAALGMNGIFTDVDLDGRLTSCR